MGEILGLEKARQARAERRRLLAKHAVMHPALRWLARRGNAQAHRRHPGGSTACGLPGPLILADKSFPFCPVCYPYWAKTGS